MSSKGMREMIEAFDHCRQDSVASLEGTDLYKYYSSAGPEYSKYRRIEELFKTKDIKRITDEICKRIAQSRRFAYGITHSESYHNLDVDFDSKFRERFKENDYRADRKRKKKDGLLYILRYGHPNIKAKELQSFLIDNKESFKRMCISAVIIELACEASSHKERYINDRIDRIIQSRLAIGDSGQLTVNDKDVIELLRSRLEETARSVAPGFMIKLFSSTHTMTSMVIIDNSFIKNDDKNDKLNIDKRNQLANPNARFHYAVFDFDPLGSDCDAKIVNRVYCYDSFDETYKEYKFNLEEGISSLCGYDGFSKIDKTGLDCFGEVLGSGTNITEDINKSGDSRISTTNKSGAFFREET